MNLSIVLITTNLPNPTYDLLDRCINKINALQTDIIDEKILSIDMFEKQGVSADFFNKYTKTGWKLIYGKAGSSRGQAENQLRGISQCKNEYILTCEDDTMLLWLPTYNDLKYLIDRQVGF